MKIDFSQKLKDLDGKIAKERDIEGNVLGDLTLGKVSTNALVGMIKGEELNGKKSFERYQIAQKIANSKKETDLKTDEIKEIKDRIGVFYGPSVVGPAYQLLEKEESSGH
jgi:hypothetical protein